MANEPSTDISVLRKDYGRWLYPSCLFLVTFLFFAKTILSGALPAPLDILAIRYPWVQLSPAFSTQEKQGYLQNPLLSDQTEVFIPGLHFTWEQMRQGHIPLWTPTEMGGAPFLANDQSAVLYPPNMLAYLLPFPLALCLIWMIRPLGAGLGMYFFLCAIGLRRAAAFFGAIAFMFSSFFVVWLGWPLPSVATWLPWVMLGAEKLLQGDRPRARWIALLAFATGSHLLAGHIETSTHIFLAFGIYCLCRAPWLLRVRRDELREVVGRYVLLGGGTLLGIAFATVQLLPTAWYLVANSYTFEARQHGPSFPALPLPDLISWFVPYFKGNPAYAVFGHDFPSGFFNFNERVGYCGVVTLVFAAFAFVHPRTDRRPYQWTFVIVAAVAAGIIYGFGPIRGIAIRLPGLQLADNMRLTMVVAFALAALGAIGFDGIIERLGHIGPWRRTRLKIVDLICLTGAGIFVLGSAFVSKNQIVSIIARLTPAHFPLSKTAWARSWIFIALLLIGASLVLIWLVRTSRIQPHLGLTALVLLLIGDMYLFGVEYNPRTSAQDLYPPTPLTEAIRSLGPSARVTAPLNFFAMNFAQWYDFRTLEGYEGLVLARAHDFAGSVNRNGPNIGDWTHVAANESPDYHLLAIASVTHILLLTSEAEPEGVKGHLVLQHEDNGDVAFPSLTPGAEEAQTFTAPTDDISAIGFTIHVEPQTPAATLAFRLVDVATGAEIVNREVSTAGLKDKGLLTISFPPLEHSRNRQYRASLTAKTGARSAPMPALYGNTTLTLTGGQYFRDRRPASGSLRMRLYESTTTDGITPVWQGGSGTLYALDHARPRAYIADAVFTAPNGDSALTALDQLHVPGNDAVVESDHPIASTGGTATILRDDPGDIIVRVQTDTPGFLVLSEGYGDGGWQVDVDGKRTRDLHANYLYQGVMVPTGEHIVHFRYRPLSFTLGAAISGVAGIGIVALLALPLLLQGMRRRRREEPSHDTRP